ncbi:MAG: 3-oxoacyl-ACP reductase [Leptothrix sp. (in: Bacteria)]|nr:3-oxoacyl-ACP reductase [Leptothrix sp. (in: b-proteobacteria)]
MLLQGRVALVTGASKGIGRAIAERFAHEGAALVLNARSDSVDGVAEGIRAAGGSATVVRGDIADAAVVKQCIQACRSTHGRLDVLVNNAGAMPQAMLGMISLADARALFELNVIATINLTQFAARAMKSGGSIINISSIARAGLPGASVYSATKGAVASFTLAAAKELGPRGIRVNALAPGFIDTDLTRDTKAEVRQRTLAGIRLGRIGSATEVAGSALFLASDLSSYVTGQVLGVDGGMMV